MVKLLNILLNKNIISCDYAPENCNQTGHVDMDIITKELINITYSEYEYGKKMYVSHVRKKLIEIINMSEIPAETVAIWY